MKLVTTRKFNHLIEKGLNLSAGKLLKRRNWFNSLETSRLLKQIDLFISTHSNFFASVLSCLTYFVLSGGFSFWKGFVRESEGLWADWLFMIRFSNSCFSALHLHITQLRFKFSLQMQTSTIDTVSWSEFCVNFRQIRCVIFVKFYGFDTFFFFFYSMFNATTGGHTALHSNAWNLCQ